MNSPGKLFSALAVLFYLAASLYRIGYPGLHYDEMYFADAALGVVDGTFVRQMIGPVPFYLLEYLGALKAWLYWPIFALFDVSIWSIRLPVILLTAFALALYWRLAKKLGGDRCAWMAVLLLAMNPTFVYGTKADFGPVVLEFLLQTSAALLFFSGGGPWALGLLFLFGLFNKINFVWWVFGFTGAAFLIHKERRRATLPAAAAGTAFFLWWYFYSGIQAGHEGSMDLATRWKMLVYNIPPLLEGGAYHRTFFGYRPEAWGAGALWILAAAGGFFWLQWKKQKGREAAKFLGLQLLLTLVAIVFTHRARAFWHFFALLPWFVLFAALVFSRLNRAGFALWALGFTQLAVMHFVYFDTARKPHQGSVLVTEAIYNLIEFCRPAEVRCFSAEWGMHSQLQAFLRDPKRFRDFPRHRDFEAGPFYVVYVRNRTGISTGRGGKRNFFHQAEEAGWKIELDRQIADPDGQPTYDLYRLLR